MISQITPASLVVQSCDYLFSGECICANVNGGRLKRNRKTTIIYQYPYEFECQNAGLCWIQEGIRSHRFRIPF